MKASRHIGGECSATLAAWAAGEGAGALAARELARVLLARWAGRSTDARPSRRLLSLAEETFSFALPHASAATSADGTVRLAVRADDGAVVETVLIPHPARTTVCLSSQAGCARGCVFCETGRLGLSRQLTAAEISCQLALATRHLAEHGRPPPTNVVFMGMGEPLDNLEAVLGAVEAITDDCGFGIAPRRVTVSTIGIVPKMRELYRRSRCRVAVSLHAANDADRRRLLPGVQAWDLAALREAIAESPDTVLLQWTLIAGQNDGETHLRELLEFCRGLDVRVNLIPLNPGPEDAWRAPQMDEVRRFQRGLRDQGIRCLVRMPHGQEVGGACGQLAGALRGREAEKPRLPVVGRARRS